jgi:transposase
VLAGQRYRDVASALSRSVGSVVRAVRRMIEVGLLDPVRLIAAQHGPARLAARRLAVGWGLMREPEQMALALE